MRADCSGCRAITSRATITSTRLVNTYEWGDFKGDPYELMAKYFDVFIYYANWSSRRLMLRIPAMQLDLKLAQQYCAKGGRKRAGSSLATVTTAGSNLLIDLWSDDESEDKWEDPEPDDPSSVMSIRSELIAGNYYALYLSWLLRVQFGEIPAGTPAPPKPRSGKRLTGAQQALVEFLRIRL